MEYIESALLGYVLGSINPAYLLGKLKGFDIRERGTGNAGASNTMVVMGWPYRIVVCLYDITKAILAFFIAVKLFPTKRVMHIIAGCCAVIGHCCPFYLNFKGGKGFASFIGVSFMIDAKACLAILAFGLTVAILMKYIIRATTNQAVAFSAFMVLSGKFAVVECAIVLITSFIILYKHRRNYHRFFRRQELGYKDHIVGIRLFKD